MPSVTQCAYNRETAEATFNEHNLGTYTIGYIVQTDGLMGPQSVANGALLSSPHPLPSLWSTYSYNGDTDAYSWARDYKVTRDPKSVKQYYITVEYRPLTPGEGSQTSGEDPINSEPNPIARPPVVWWDREVTTEEVIRDIDGEAIVNPLGHYYTDGIEIEKPKGIRVVEINVATEGEVATLERMFDGAVNASAWSVGGISIPARAACCREVSGGAPITEAGYVYFHVVFRFAFAEEGKTWDQSMPQLGEWYWIKTGGTYDTIQIDGQFVRKVGGGDHDYNLNEDGTRKADGDPITFKDYRIRREVDFGDLPF